ncbi:MAG: helix-turn-helix transcriptional regulator [Chloroflexia bacterium]|nr:helix-turn-helix transcriptional regulator [Chloroflexia bacterium]
MRDQTLGQFIRANRLAMGLTQEALATKVGDNVRQSDISRIEKDGVDFPRRERLDAIAVALGVTLGDLLISTGWLEIEHAQMIEQIKDNQEPDPDVLDDAMAVLSVAKEMVAETADLLVRAEGHVVSLMAAQAKRDKDRKKSEESASDDA